MKRWWLLGAVIACGGATNPRPVVLNAPVCAASRAPIETDIAAGSLIRAQRRLAIAAARCTTDPWIEKTKGEVTRALESAETGDALLAKGTNADRDRALLAFERSEHADASVEVAGSRDDADRSPTYSPGGGYVQLGPRVVDVRAGRVVARLDHDDEIAFSPDDAKVAIASKTALRVVALPSGEELLRYAHAISFAGWSDDGAWLAWSGEHAGWAEIATKRIHLLGAETFRGTPLVARGVVAAPTDAGGVVVKRVSNDELVARFAKADSYAIDRKADRLLLLEDFKGPLRELDLATGKTLKLPWRPPRYNGMCGEEAGWRIVALDRDTLNLTRDCSGVDNATLDMKTGRAKFETIADGQDVVPPEEEWGHDDKSTWQDVSDVDFTTMGRVVRAPKRETFAGFDRAGRARVWTKAGKVVWAGPARPEQVVAFAPTPDGSELVTLSHASELRRWNVKTGALLATRALPGDCRFLDLAMRDDGEAVIACTIGDDLDRFYRERSKDAVLERKRRNMHEKPTLDRRGAFVVFSTYNEPTLVVALEPNAKPVERALPDPKKSLVAAAGDSIILADGIGDRALHRWSTGAVLLAIPSEAPNHNRRWIGFANRGAWLAVERTSSLDFFSIDAAVTQVASLWKPPSTPESVALAGPRGPFAVHGAIDLATWSSPDDKPTLAPAYVTSKSVEWDAPRTAFVFADTAGISFREAGRPSLDLFAVPFTDTFTSVDAVTHTVTRGGDRALAADLVECHVGTRRLPYAICAGRFDPL